MKGVRENLLRKAASSYLRSARHQPVQWREWGSEAFGQALLENKPVLLDVGAVWCHWCHVMDRESYENEEIAALINEHYIAVKVDRDERPDIDTRYQAAVSAISGQSGWPLTAFLTPDGKPYFGGTYFPPEDRYGRPGLRRVLATMAEAFHAKRDEVNESAESILSSVAHNEAFSASSGEPANVLLGKIVDSIVAQFDARNGGFGAQPKFPHSGALDLLIDAGSRRDASTQSPARFHQAASVSLKKMAAGGAYDHLAGGFHRYSVDERWIVPHFEKMAYDNSELLKNYVHAFQTFGQIEFALVARDIIRWMDEWLSDREQGGFYASQDADESLHDDGDYFTWTRAEARDVLSDDEFRVAALHFDLRDVGDMHHNPRKNVLHIGAEPSSIAQSLGFTEGSVLELIAAAKRKLYAARLKRPAPFVDKTIYAGWNGMCISAYLEAARVLGMPEVQEFALRSLHRVLHNAWSEERGLAHVVAYGDGANAGRGVAGILDDYAFLANAALDAWEATGEMRYFAAAEEIARAIIDRFYDEADAGFFDTELPDDPVAIGMLNVRRKPLQDAPTPSGNAMAATVLLRLHALTGNVEYDRKAKETLAAFAGVVEHLGLYAASYALALRRSAVPPLQLCVLGDDDNARLLLAAATVGYAVNKSVIRLTKEQLQALPPSLAEALPHLRGEYGSFAVVCEGNSCQLPVTDPDALADLLRGRKAVAGSGRSGGHG